MVAAQAAKESADAAVAASRAWIIPNGSATYANGNSVELNWINAGVTPAIDIRIFYRAYSDGRSA
jgi:hypothetical protein